MRKITGIVIAVCLILGLFILLYNPISGWVLQHQMEEGIDEFEQNNNVFQEALRVGNVESEVLTKYPDLLADMQCYNQELYESGQTGLVDAWSYTQPAFDLTQYGLSADVVGVLDIPAMGEILPVYLGASKENMARGVAVLGQTSMPVGGENTNCVIAGHRGYRGAAYLREIEVLVPGDLIYLTTYWGKKTYVVETTDIIEPDDIQAIRIREGQELLTLVTCHPYAVATQRYVVYCAALKNNDENTHVESENADSANHGQAVAASSRNRIRLEQRLPFLAIPLIAAIVIILIRSFKKERRKPGKE